jgi:hypothetical protein
MNSITVTNNNASSEDIKNVITLEPGVETTIYDSTNETISELGKEVLLKCFNELKHKSLNGEYTIKIDSVVINSEQGWDLFQASLLPIVNNHYLSFIDGYFKFDTIRKRLVITDPLSGKQYKIQATEI